MQLTREGILGKSVPIRNFAGQAKLRGKKEKLLSCGCCVVVNFKDLVEEARCNKEIEQFKKDSKWKS